MKHCWHKQQHLTFHKCFKYWYRKTKAHYQSRVLVKNNPLFFCKALRRLPSKLAGVVSTLLACLHYEKGRTRTGLMLPRIARRTQVQAMPASRCLLLWGIGCNAKMSYLLVFHRSRRLDWCYCVTLQCSPWRPMIHTQGSGVFLCCDAVSASFHRVHNARAREGGRGGGDFALPSCFRRYRTYLSLDVYELLSTWPKINGASSEKSKIDW